MVWRSSLVCTFFGLEQPQIIRDKAYVLPNNSIKQLLQRLAKLAQVMVEPTFYMWVC